MKLSSLGSWPMNLSIHQSILPSHILFLWGSIIPHVSEKKRKLFSPQPPSLLPSNAEQLVGFSALPQHWLCFIHGARLIILILKCEDPACAFVLCPLRENWHQQHSVKRWHLLIYQWWQWEHGVSTQDHSTTHTLGIFYFKFSIHRHRLLPCLLTPVKSTQVPSSLRPYFTNLTRDSGRDWSLN